MHLQKILIKPQTLKPGNLSAPWDTRMLNTSFERSIFFLQHKILKEWFIALLRWFMQCQSSLILLHKVAFQPFWLDLTVYHKSNKQLIGKHFRNSTLKWEMGINFVKFLVALLKKRVWMKILNFDMIKYFWIKLLGELLHTWHNYCFMPAMPIFKKNISSK